MLWLCIRLPDLPHEALAGTGVPLPELRTTRHALTRLAIWAHQWSSQVSCRAEDQADAMLWLEIGNSQRLFGAVEAMADSIREALAALGYTGISAIAPTPQGALLLTHARAGNALNRETLLQRLAPLPLSLLALPVEVLAALQASGLRRIGEVLHLPPAAITRRFGLPASHYLQRLQGRMPDPLPAVTLPARYASHCDFDGEVVDTTTLLFPLQRLLGEFQGYLRARELAVQRCTVRLVLRGEAPIAVSLGFSQPCREAAQMLAQARERLAQLTLIAPVRVLHLEAAEFTAPCVLQTDAFSRAAEQGQQLQQTLDRLRARLGDDCVQYLQCRPDHRPERAWQGAAEQRQSRDATSTATAPRPCWLLPSPALIARPTQLLCGPERIESGWWDHADAARDYYVALAGATRQWVFHDLRSGQWFLHGLWS